jgi:hypothetical protein
MFNKLKNFSYLSVDKSDITGDHEDYTLENTLTFEAITTMHTFKSNECLFNKIHKSYVPSLFENETENLITPGLKYVYKNHLVFERPPTHKLVNCYSTDLNSIDEYSKTSSYYLPIPWQLYIVEFDPSNMRTCNVSMFFMQTPLLSEDQTLYLPPIPNFYVNGSLCRPFFSSLEDIERYSQDISGIIASAYDWVWASNFNLDLTETISSIYKQKNPIQISRGLGGMERVGYRIPISIINEVYSHWETLPLSEVVNYTWPNSAYNQTFDGDADISDDHLSDLVHQWIEDQGLLYEDDEEYDSLCESVVNSEEFRSTILDPRKVVKNYSQIIENIFQRSYFLKLSNRSLHKKLVDMFISGNSQINQYVDEPF